MDSFDWTNKELFLHAANPGTKADIWRYEILQKIGGLYVDVDFVCLKPFDFFHDRHRLSFYSGFIWNLRDYAIANGLIACAPNHPILNKIVDHLSGLEYKNKEANSAYIMENVGQGLLSKCVAEHNPCWKRRDIYKRNSYIFSPGIFYPIAPKHWRKMEDNNLQIPEFLLPKLEDAYAVHLYARSWVPEQDSPSKLK